MEKHQVERDGPTWRGNINESERGASRAKRLSEERMMNRELADRRRAEYLRLHDDDEAELELPR